jgi:restriction system protein
LAQLFEALGYRVSKTPPTGDGGVDLVLVKDGQKTVVQRKAHNKRISIDVARKLVASMQDFGANVGIIACFEGVTGPTREYIALRKIQAMDLSMILALQRSVNLNTINIEGSGTKI